jgi:hypothetical protein
VGGLEQAEIFVTDEDRDDGGAFETTKGSRERWIGSSVDPVSK